MDDLITSYLSIQGPLVAKRIAEEIKTDITVRSEAEARRIYKERIQRLAVEGDTPELVPITMQVNTTRNSETVTHQLNSLRKDLESRFANAKYMGEVHELQNSILNGGVRESIRGALDVVESIIEREEMFKRSFLKGSTTGLFTRFIDDSVRYDRSDSHIQPVDPRTGVLYEPSQEMISVGMLNGLTLPVKTASRFSPVSINIVHSKSTAERPIRGGQWPTSTGRTTIPFPKENCIDGRSLTFFEYTIKTTVPILGGAVLTLDLDAPGRSIEANYIEIHPSVKRGQWLKAITVEDSDGNIYEVTPFSPVELSRKVRCSFEKASIKGIAITLHNPNHDTDNNYLFGLDNIYMGLESYESEGYYLTKGIKVDTLNSIAGIVDVLHTEPRSPTVELWAIVETLRGSLSDTRVLPLYAATDTLHEELIPSIGDVSITNFAVGDTVKIYRDNELLIEGIEYSISTSEQYESGSEVLIPGSYGSRWKFRIEYTPKMLSDTTPTPWTNQNGSLGYTTSGKTILLTRDIDVTGYIVYGLMIVRGIEGHSLPGTVMSLAIGVEE